MKQKTVASLVLVLVLIGGGSLALFGSWNSKQETLRANGHVATLGPTGKSDPASATVEGKSPPPLERELAARAVDFDQIHSASQLVSRLEAMGEGDVQAMQYLRTAAQYCEGIAFKARVAQAGRQEGKPDQETGKNVAEVQSAAYLANFGKAYCDRELPSFTALTGRIAASGSAGDLVQAEMLSEIAAKGDAALALGRAATLVDASESPDAVERAAQFLVLGSAAGGLPQARGVPVPASLAGESASAQMLAIKRLACTMRGGCGPDGFYSVLECESRRNCRPGISAEAVWRDSYSPEFLAYSDAVYQQLVASRRH